jgi:carbamoyl-phosphate synthase small subunit
LKGYIALEDGTVFEGKSFGSPGETVGEVVFNTSLTGYQEILTDPSYASQIVTMTYPLIGNYGINPEDIESDRVAVSGFVVKEACRYPSNFTSVKSVGQYLQENNIVGVEGIDTRALTRHIRLAGAMKAVIYAGERKASTADLVDKARAWIGTGGVDTVKGVTCQKTYEFKGTPGRTKSGGERYRIVAMDFGIKFNILRLLRSLGCHVTVVPASTPASEILALKPDGVFLSNGPGDPAGVTYAIQTIRELIGRQPIFGICLGHQLLTLALGGKTYKLKFGHHGGNHPVRNIKTKAIEITAQNHCYCADMESLQDCGVSMTHLNLYDNTCEGMALESKSLFSVQYHPEAAPGPHDSGYLFKQFIDMMEEHK